ncbi:DoxX family protein [Compostibacter hankyongensis]|uniref:DoxX family protein n=1 Tax=Compostibacter hankyongensis TaxID=1007089 RepID=A0ABP8FLY0_9BACT
MKKINIIYWIFTGLLLALMLFSGVTSLVNPESTKALISTHLGYPEYFGPLISIAKILGVIAILVPGFSRLKEWAYAGFTFDLVFAVLSFIAVGDPVSGTWFMFFGLILVFGSYIFYHKKRKQAGSPADVKVAGSEVSMG